MTFNERYLILFTLEMLPEVITHSNNVWTNFHLNTNI